jgi:DNA-binding transcriptional MerR regulator
MFMMQPMAQSESDLYDIGAVSRLTGLSTANLRMWEKRHQVVNPERSKSQRRLYSSEDIQRLSLLKSLVDRGNSIGSIASLGTSQLEARLKEQANIHQGLASKTGRQGPCSIIVAGDSIQELLSRGDEIPGARISERFTSLEEAEEGIGDSSADLLIIETATLFPESIARIQSLAEGLSAMRAIVIYRFAQSKTAELIEKDLEGVTAILAPVNVAELRLACGVEIAMTRGASSPLDDKVLELEVELEQLPKRLFTDAQLAKITRVSTTIECECPHHMANLLGGLTAFEQYSAQCENRGPKDAELHAFLHRTTAKARALMERGLRELIRIEGIEVH